MGNLKNAFAAFKHELFPPELPEELRDNPFFELEEDPDEPPFVLEPFLLYKERLALYRQKLDEANAEAAVAELISKERKEYLRSQPKQRSTTRHYGKYKISDYITSTNTDAEALQAIFNDIGNERNPIIDLEGIVLTTDRTVYYYPKTNSQRFKIYDGRIHGIDDTFDLLAPDPALKSMRIGFTSDDNNVIKYTHRLDVDNVIFRRGKDQLVLVNQRASKITNCAFELGNRGILAIFVQQGVVDSCQFQFHDTESLVARTAVSDGTLMAEWGMSGNPNDDKWFENPSSSNSQCNRFTVRDSWSFCQPGQRASWRMQGSDGVTFDNCVSEGADPWYSYHLDSRNSTTVDTCNILRPHIEHGATKSLIYARAMKSVFISKLRSQIPDNVILEVVDGTYPQIIFDHLCYIPFDNPSFKLNKNVTVSFRDPVQDLSNFRSWGRYSGGVPAKILVQRGGEFWSFGYAGLRFGSWMKINGNVQENSMTFAGHTVVKDHWSYVFRGKQTNFVQSKYD